MTALRKGGFIHGLKTLLGRATSDIYGACRRIRARAAAKNGVVVLPVQGSLMALRLDDPGLSRTLIRDGIREKEHTQLIYEEIHAGMVGVDLGANLGYYALLEAKLVGPRGRVLAVEPVPKNADLLRRNVALNNYRHMQVYEIAIAEACGEAEMWITPESNFCNLSSESDESLTQEMRNVLTGRANARQITVPVMTLDRFLEEQRISTINFIRMDIEGFEVKITSGMRRTFKKSTQELKMFVEVHNSHFVNPLDTVGMWVSELFDLGFRPKALAVPGHTQGIVRDLSPEGFPELLCSFRASCPHVLFVKNG